jgi:methyl-accepting chemotaxis protein
MIEESVKNSKNGVDIAGEVGKVLDEIVQSIGKTTDLVSEIAAASQEQAQGIDQVNTAVAQMDKVTQQNAANAEESASASEELSSQAESMNDIVGELVALVGGTATKHTTKRSTGVAQHQHLKGNSERGREQASASQTNAKKASHLGASDHVFHKIADKPLAEVAAHKAIPLDDEDGFERFNK